jgi:acyl dehydratase
MGLPDIEELAGLIGTEIGAGPWLVIEQERIDAFTVATDDHQWIHIDPERAAAGPYGATIVQGYLTMSLLPHLTREIALPVGEPRMTINYGLDRVRFPSPVRVGSRVRARVRLTGVSEITSAIQIKRQVTVEVDGSDKPAMVAETVTRFLY